MYRYTFLVYACGLANTTRLPTEPNSNMNRPQNFSHISSLSSDQKRSGLYEGKVIRGETKAGRKRLKRSLLHPVSDVLGCTSVVFIVVQELPLPKDRGGREREREIGGEQREQKDIKHMLATVQHRMTPSRKPTNPCHTCCTMF